MPWLLNIAYVGILLLASPVLLYRMLVRGKYRDGWSEKFLGLLPMPPKTRNTRIWFHAVSVGEVLQLQTVVTELRRRNPDVDIIVTTTTSTGLAVAQEKFPEHHVCYFPLDFTWAVRHAVRRIEPDVVVLVELELWPNFVREVHRRGVPLLLINGRISEKSFRGYEKLRFLMKGLLNRFTHLAVQNETYGRRLCELGAHPDRVTVTGSIKFDAVETSRDNPQTAELRESFGFTAGETIFIAGSTHAPEEELALNAWQRLREEFPQLRLILVPRHKERFEEVARLVESRGLRLLRRSEAGSQRSEVGGRTSEVRGRRSEVGGQTSEIGGRRSEISALDDNTNHQSPIINHQSPPPNPQSPIRNPQSPVLLLDTLGELSACWGLADIAFVGGSLTKRGGQNMIEPAGYGAAVLFGPNTRNFRDVVELLLDGDAAREVADEVELTETLRQLLDEPADRLAMGRHAQRLVSNQHGAAGRTVEVIQRTAGFLTIEEPKEAAA